MQQGPAWYAIWTRSRHEQVVREQLERKGLEAFLPTITRWSRWKDRKKQIDWPLFPGYCFARFDSAERLPVLKCTGVVNIVSFDGDIAPIPEQEIDGIRRLVQSDLQFDPCPLMRGGSMGTMIAMKTASSAATIFFAERMWKKNRVGAVIVMAALNGASAAIVAHNQRNARR